MRGQEDYNNYEKEQARAQITDCGLGTTRVCVKRFKVFEGCVMHVDVEVYSIFGQRFGHI